MLFVIIIFLLGVIALLIYMYNEAFTDRVVCEELSFPDFPKSMGEVNLFFISDIHKRKITDNLIEKVSGKVDLVIIGGDIVERGVPIEQVKENLLKLKQIAPLYFVWGNNDYEVDYHELDATMLDCGVKILDNTAVYFESETGEVINLIGVDDLGCKRDRLDLALLDAMTEGFNILVSHNPAIIKKINHDHNIRLILSGHTHGGQIRLFGFGPYEKGSIKQTDNTIVLTSNGYGTTGVPFRLGAKAETHLIKLKNG